MNELRPAVVLLVEDDPGDQKLVRVSLKAQKIANELHIVDSGEEALDFLYHRGSHSGAPRPDLILLDLNMPGIGGKEFLRRVKQDELMNNIPIIILTTSDADKDILDSYSLQASGYVKKPVELQELKEVMKEITEYWFVICRLPGQVGGGGRRPRNA